MVLGYQLSVYGYQWAVNCPPLIICYLFLFHPSSFLKFPLDFLANCDMNCFYKDGLIAEMKKNKINLPPGDA
jgi:hypothetical protein